MSQIKKLLIITPHLSTGGAPQVTLNKIELLKDDFEIKCVEYSLIAWNFVIQRNKIIDLLKSNFHSLGNNKLELLDIITQFNPDVISLEEFPEFFMDETLITEIYKKNRSYKIFETTHDSSFPVENKKWMPDKFIFVSPFNLLRYSHLEIPMEVIEYPVDKKTKNKESKQSLLNLSPDWKHVVNVGLFTPRKNQKYLFEIAEYLKNYKIKFHFIGNHADNFKFYWEPLMKNKPKNCVIWYERNDVNNFLQACDMFFFASKGDKHNKELNPIAIKEALEYDIPIMMYNLDVYLDKYNYEKNITFLTGNLVEDCNNLLSILNPKKIEVEEEVVIISTYPNTKNRKDLTEQCINSFKKLGKKIILTSHYPVSESIQNLVDYCVFDKNNCLTYHSYYNHFYNHTSIYDVKININNLSNSNQSFAAHTNFFNGVKLAKELGYEKVMIVTYDVILNDLDVPLIGEYFNKLSTWKCCLSFLDTELGKGVETTSMVFNINYFLQIFPDFKNENEFNNHCKSLNSQNFLEDYYMHVLGKEENLWIVPNSNTILPNSGVGLSSVSEYYSILPISGKQNEWMFYFFSYNLDDRKIEVIIEENQEKITEDSFIVSQSREYMKKIIYNKNEIKITVNFYDFDNIYKTEKFSLNESTIQNYLNNGHFIEKNKIELNNNFKIKLIHLQTTLNDEREQKSRNSLYPLKDLGINYVLHQNEPYTDLPPIDNCLRPQCISPRLFDDNEIKLVGTALTPAHYGCYESFKKGILTEFTEDIDFLIVCEGDCILEVEPSEFIDKLHKCCKIINEQGIEYFSFGDTSTLDFGWKQSHVIYEVPNQDLLFITNKIIGLQCIMFPKFTREFLINQLNTHKWDAADIYFNTIYVDNNKKMGIINKRITTQADGYSLIDQTNKTFLK